MYVYSMYTIFIPSSNKSVNSKEKKLSLTSSCLYRLGQEGCTDQPGFIPSESGWTNRLWKVYQAFLTDMNFAWAFCGMLAALLKPPRIWNDEFRIVYSLILNHDTVLRWWLYSMNRSGKTRSQHRHVWLQNRQFQVALTSHQCGLASEVFFLIRWTGSHCCTGGGLA